jgi:hypothetical protein
MQNVDKLAPLISALHDPWCHFISGFLWVSLAEYLLVLRVYFPPVADDQFYFGCCKYCLLLARDED